MIEFQLVTAEQLRAVDPEGISWPDDTFGVVAFEDGKLVGRTAILQLPIVEGTMVVPEKQGSSLAYRLVQKVEEMYLSLGKTHAWAMASLDQPEVSDYLKRVGYTAVPVVLYTKDLIAREKAA